MPHATTGKSLSELLHGRRPRTKLEAAAPRSDGASSRLQGTPPLFRPKADREAYRPCIVSLGRRDARACRTLHQVGCNTAGTGNDQSKGVHPGPEPGRAENCLRDSSKSEPGAGSTLPASGPGMGISVDRSVLCCTGVFWWFWGQVASGGVGCRCRSAVRSGLLQLDYCNCVASLNLFVAL